MKIIHFRKEDLSKYGIETSCEVFTIHVRIDDVKTRASEMIKTISDRSWINKLNSVGRTSFEARAKRTIDRLVTDIFSKVENSVTSEFGEYMISDTAQCALENECKHTKVPIAELIKEKVIGNPGFDFHTESTSEIIVFGEAKYSSTDNPHGEAISQIIEFIHDEKDLMDLAILDRFVSSKSVKNACDGIKAYIAAFSLNSSNPCLIFKNALTSGNMKKLYCYPELYLIGVEVCA